MERREIASSQQRVAVVGVQKQLYNKNDFYFYRHYIAFTATTLHTDWNKIQIYEEIVKATVENDINYLTTKNLTSMRLSIIICWLRLLFHVKAVHQATEQNCWKKLSEDDTVSTIKSFSVQHFLLQCTQLTTNHNNRGFQRVCLLWRPLKNTLQSAPTQRRQHVCFSQRNTSVSCSTFIAVKTLRNKNLRLNFRSQIQAETQFSSTSYAHSSGCYNRKQSIISQTSQVAVLQKNAFCI